MLKFFGMADLGIVQQQNGLLSSFSGEPLRLVGDSGQVIPLIDNTGLQKQNPPV